MQRDVGVWRAGGGDRRRLGVTMTEDFRAGRELAPGLYDWRGALHVDEERFSAPPAATRPTRPTWPPPGRRSAASRRGTAPRGGGRAVNYGYDVVLARLGRLDG